MRSSLRRCLRLSLVYLLAFAAVACTPLHTVKPLPNFVKEGLTAGDKVTVTTHAGDERELVLTKVRSDALVGDDVEIALIDIATIKKHAWSRPESPCGGEKPLGCSLPLLVSLASELHNHYTEIFYDACADHDYCYRHGAATYGMDRDSCDEAFLNDMQALCPAGATSKVGKVFEVFDDSLDSRQNCETVADDYYNAVRRYGAEKFEAAGSTYCEYNGPPRRLPRASDAPSGSPESP